MVEITYISYHHYLFQGLEAEGKRYYPATYLSIPGVAHAGLLPPPKCSYKKDLHLYVIPFLVFPDLKGPSIPANMAP